MGRTGSSYHPGKDGAEAEMLSFIYPALAHEQSTRRHSSLILRKR